ncbi:MAG: glycosyltransferase family 4 protein [Algoriphagus sp.]|uniref:glycosyltransferase n=1 Tax=Algoriphagus sp. TaxID=1872435 RepID=UPI0017D7C014|nr:glycosyltransferase [Algoriphagus sp.]NVJ86769.1 glycosyltransferase family 4 protein [Algoriphagus sp.]
MRLWEKNVDELIIVAPLSKKEPSPIDLPYLQDNIKFISIPEFNILGTKNLLRSIFLLPVILFKIARGMFLCDHIHLRCPGNVGLLSSFVQIFFPFKNKTAKYAGNWDPKSAQPWSYRVQRKILRSELLTKNMSVLVYGEWLDNTKNIIPFFTASYLESDKRAFNKPDMDDKIRLIFVGGLFSNKNPEIALKVCSFLKAKNIRIELVFCGDGPEYSKLLALRDSLELKDEVKFLGNVSAERVRDEFIQAHFLIFVSDSEGWPKVVAEAMWWGCIPITTPVSCVPQMLGYGERGFLTQKDSKTISNIIEDSLMDPNSLFLMRNRAIAWAHQYTLEKFEREIKKLL